MFIPWMKSSSHDFVSIAGFFFSKQYPPNIFLWLCFLGLPFDTFFKLKSTVLDDAWHGAFQETLRKKNDKSLLIYIAWTWVVWPCRAGWTRSSWWYYGRNASHSDFSRLNSFCGCISEMRRWERLERKGGGKNPDLWAWRYVYIQ